MDGGRTIKGSRPDPHPSTPARPDPAPPPMFARRA